MWEQMLDGLLAVLFAIVSSLICSYVILCTGTEFAGQADILPAWVLLGCFGILYGGVLCTGRPYGAHYAISLPALLWLMSLWEAVRLEEQGMPLAIKGTGVGLHLGYLLLLTWRRTRK